MSMEEIKEEVVEEQVQTPEEENCEPEKKKCKKDSKLKKEIEKLEAEKAEANDKYLRLAAEYDNFRRRSQKEKENSYADAYADALKEILPIIDNLERATAFKDNDKVSEGLELTLTQFKTALEKLGVTEIESAPGTAFDPNLHNAVMHEENEEFGENQISEVFQKGYIRGERVIRYAMVKVAN